MNDLTNHPQRYIVNREGYIAGIQTALEYINAGMIQYKIKAPEIYNHFTAIQANLQSEIKAAKKEIEKYRG